uniref:Uncharacterized protein n=1 Tax=Rhizophora mucronata TaxID=61149 RepID=A0A2P2Q7Y4_RHIMU
MLTGSYNSKFYSYAPLHSMLNGNMPMPITKSGYPRYHR